MLDENLRDLMCLLFLWLWALWLDTAIRMQDSVPLSSFFSLLSKGSCTAFNFYYLVNLLTRIASCVLLANTGAWGLKWRLLNDQWGAYYEEHVLFAVHGGKGKNKAWSTLWRVHPDAAITAINNTHWLPAEDVSLLQVVEWLADMPALQNHLCCCTLSCMYEVQLCWSTVQHAPVFQVSYKLLNLL